MKQRRSLVVIIFAILLGQMPALAQQYPVSITNFNISPSVFLSDYTSPGSGGIKATLKFTDYNEASADVYLKLTIEGANAKLMTSPSFRPTMAYTLVPGEPYSIQDADFTPYFLFQNLVCQGITQADLQRTDQLPEGWYTFTIQALDLRSGKALSAPASTRAHLALIDPPTLFAPTKGQFVKTTIPQITFQWQQNAHTVLSKLNVEYYVQLYEIPDGENPLTAMQNKSARQVAITNAISGRTYSYGPSDFPLTPGKRYAYTIKAQDANGHKWFKNDGVSEVGWFYYGYPTGGHVALLYPKNEDALNRRMVQKLEWAACDNLVDNTQPVVYRVKMAELKADANPATAIGQTDEWSFESSEILNKSGYSSVLKNVDSEARYVWQVKAFTDGVEVGTSDIQTFYAPPSIEEFVASSGHIVEVTAITNSNLSDLAGRGKIKATASGKKVDIHFEHLRIENIDGIMLLTAGQIQCALDGQLEPITLRPSTAVNDKATCYPDSIRINTEGMFIKGRVEWDYPFGTATKEKSKVRFQPTWFDYNDNYRLSGAPQVVSEQSYNLVEPAKFYMKLGDKSYAQVLRNEWEMIFSGQIFVNEKVVGTESEYYSIDFSEWRELHYNRMENYRNPNEIHLLANTKLNLVPRTVIVDLSEEFSPSKFSDEPAWKGIYFENFDLRFIPEVDERGQIKLTQEIFNNYTLAVADTCRAWVIGDGLHFRYATQIAEEGIVQFNTFPSKVDLLSINIQKSAVLQAQLKGSIRIPVISQTDRYAYTVPITSSGFQTGYLDKSLDGLSFIFNEASRDQRLQARVKRAVFSGQNRLDMDLELTWEKIGVTFKDLQQFCAWGNYDIGFVSPKGVANLTHQAQGVVEDYRINVEQMGCGRMCNQYAFAVAASVVIDDDISGVKGAPILNFYSIADNSLLHFDCSLEQQNIQTEQRFVNEGNFPMTDQGIGEPQNDRTAEQLAEQEAQQRAQAAAIIEAYNNAHDIVKQIRYDTTSAGALSVNEQEYLNSQKNDAEPVKVDELTIQEMISSLKELRALMVDISALGILKEKQQEKVKKLDAVFGDWLIALEDINKQIYTFNKLIDDFKSGAILEQVVDVAVDALMAKISPPMLKAGETAKKFITKQVTTVQNTALKEVDKLVDVSFDGIRTATAGVIKDSKIADEIIIAARDRLKKEIRYAVEKSIQDNFTSYFTGFIDTIIQVRVLGFVDTTLRTNLKKLVTGKASSISCQNIADNASGMLSTIGEDVKSLVDFKNLSTMMSNTGKDIINNFDWKQVAADILVNVAGKVVLQYASEMAGQTINALLGAAGGSALAGILGSSVSIDFNTFKIGNLKDAIKFDPSHIVVISPVFEGEGYALKLKDDPEYGNAFKAGLNGTVMVPKPFNAFVNFISGKITAGQNQSDSMDVDDELNYWYVEFGCRQLGILLSPVPLVFDGGEGRVYKHMSRPDPTAKYTPDPTNKFGAGVKAYFYDNTGGSIAVFYADFTMNVEQEGFRLRMEGEALLGNTISETGEIKRSLAKGYADMGYSNIDHIFYAKAGVTLLTAPLLCAAGEFNAYITPDFWEISVGKREQPMYARLLCKENIGVESWLVVNKSMLDVGLHMLIDIHARTPTLDLGFISLNAYAKFYFEFGAELRVFWKPLQVKDAAIYLNMALAVGIGYDLPWPLGGGDLDLLGIGFGGHLMYRSRTAEEMRALLGTPEQLSDYTGNYTVLAGGLHGHLTVIGFGIDLTLNAKKEWKE